MKGNTVQLKQMTSVTLIVLLIVSAAKAQQRKQRPKLADFGPKVQFTLPETVKVARDIVYAEYGDRKLKLDLYLPKMRAESPLPCIVAIHGGGWRMGNKNVYAHLSSGLADHGFAVACIEYRLRPEVEFPALVWDCKAAVRWVRANSKQYGIDGERIGAVGGSAGGHLVAMLATSHKVAELEGDGGNAGTSSQVQAVVAMATPADMTRFSRRNKLSEDLVALISPITHVDGDSAPLLLMHSDTDRTVPFEQSQRLAAKYKTAGVPVELVTIERGSHAFWNFEKWFGDVLGRSVKFFDKALRESKETRNGR